MYEFLTFPSKNYVNKALLLSDEIFLSNENLFNKLAFCILFPWILIKLLSSFYFAYIFERSLSVEGKDYDNKRLLGQTIL